MSVWNRIGDVATTAVNNVSKFTGEVLGAAGGVAKFAWDLGTAPWNDNKEYNGFINSIKSAAKDNGESIVKPLASAGGAVMKVPGVRPALERINYINREYIREPLTTFNLVTGDILSGRVTDAEVFDPNTWRHAYEGAQEISFGQAFVSQFRNIYDPKFNVYDPRERDAAFKQSMWGKSLSGGFDLTIQLFGDVTLVGGKAAKALKVSELGTGVLKNADAVAKAAEDITKAQYGVKNRFTKVIDDFTKNDSLYALNHPMVKSSTQPGLLAHLLGESKDVKDTALILRSALGDPVAMDELRILRRDITDAMETARGDLPTWQEFQLFSTPDEAGMLPLMNYDPAVIKAAQENMAALAKQDQRFADMMGLTVGGGTLTRTTGPLATGIEDFVAKGRAARFYDRKTGIPNVEVYQPTPFHQLYAKFSWGAQERPAGLFDFNDPDSYKEIVTTVNRLSARRPGEGRLLDITPEESKGLIDSYIGAGTPAGRSQAVLNLESFVVRKLFEKYGVDESTGKLLLEQYSRTRTSAFDSIKNEGYMRDPVDGTILKVPQLESQTANFLPVMDFELLDTILKRSSSSIKNLTLGSKDSIINVMDTFQDLFKAGALLRLGYTIRNGIDSQLRIVGALGALTAMRHLGEGLKNVVNNSVNVPARLVDNYLPADAGKTFAEIEKETSKIIGQVQELDTKIGQLEKRLAVAPDDLDAFGELTTLKILRDEKKEIYKHNSDVLTRNKKAKPKQRIGSGSYKLTASDGEVYSLHDGLGGPLSDLLRSIVSSGNSFQRLAESTSSSYIGKLTSKGIGTVTPDMPGYFAEWAKTLRQAFGNAAVPRKIAEGESLEEITRWLRNSPEGRAVRKELGIEADDASEYVVKISGFFDHYLPASSGLRGKLREITEQDLRTAFKDPSTLPIIHGNILEENIFNKGQKGIRGVINTMFKFLGTLPEDTLARNPLYVTLYRAEARRRLNVMTGLKKDRLNVQEQEQLMSESRKVALRQMKGILFNIERKSNLAAALKFISPFFSAQENAYKTWLKLVAANPAIVNRGYMVWNSPNRAGLVTDQEGNIVPEGQTSGNDIIWLDLPEGATKIPGLQSLTKFGIPKQSLDIIFQGGLDVLYNQGNPNVFSDIFPVGPYIGVPVSEIVKNQPSLEETFKWALPFGPSKGPVSGFLPAWVQKAMIKYEGQNDPQFGNTYSLISKTENEKAKRNGRPAPSPEKIMEMTKQYWNLRMWANLLLPFAPRFDSPYKFWIDKYREYNRVYGMEAKTKFLDDFPEYFSFASSLSKNPTNIQSSVQAVENIKKYDNLASDLVKIEPRLIGLMANNFAGYDFSQAAYNYLYKKKISPDSAETYLSSESPADSQKRNEAEKGWIIYNRFMDAIDNELQDRGLSSTQQAGAEDLAILKRAVITKLSRQTDNDGKPIIDPKTGQYVQTAWSDDYLDSDGSKTNRVVLGLSKMLSDDKFAKDNRNNPTWKSVSAYLDFRKVIAQELIGREVKSITAKSNVDLKILYDSVVNKLKDDDKLGFAYIYDRFLSQDLVVDKYLTVRGGK